MPVFTTPKGAFITEREWEQKGRGSEEDRKAGKWFWWQCKWVLGFF